TSVAARPTSFPTAPSPCANWSDKNLRALINAKHPKTNQQATLYHNVGSNVNKVPVPDLSDPSNYLTPKLSDGGHEAQRLQPRRPAAVRRSAWLSGRDATTFE